MYHEIMEENVKLPLMVDIKHIANNFQCNVINQFWLYKNGKILNQPIY